MSFDRWRSATASVLILAVVTFGVISPVHAGGNAVFTGKVFGTESATPLPGVVVTLVEPRSEDSFSSDPTDAEGTFRVQGAPAGSYQVVVQATEGAYLAASQVELAEGANRPVALSLTGAAPNYQTSGTSGQAQQKSGLPTWAKWTIVGGIAVIALFAIYSVTEDVDEAPASPF